MGGALTVNWDDYEIYDPGVGSPLSSVSRAEALRAYDRCMTQRPKRVEMLRRLLQANGVQLARSHEGIQGLNAWFETNVEPDPANPGRLSPEWYSVIHDAALFLGDVLIARCPQLHWEFFTGGKKDVSYQRHVIMGFTQIANPKYNLDLTRRLATYGHRLVASRGSIAHHDMVTVRGVQIDVKAAIERQPTREVEHDAFWQWVKQAESKA